MAKQRTKIRDIADYYDRYLNDVLSLRADISKLEVSQNAQAAKRFLAGLRKLRSLKKGSMTIFYNRAKKVQEEIKNDPFK